MGELSMWLVLYLVVTAFIGLMQMLEARALLKSRGQVDLASGAFSVLELAWVLPSYFAWRESGGALPWWLPALYMACVAAFSAGGVVMAMLHKGTSEDLVVPPSIVMAGGAFGAFFALASASTLLGGA